MRRPVALVLATAAFAAPAAVSLAQSPPPTGGPSQNVIADNSTAGTVVARSGVQAARGGAQSASPTNLAQASSHDCTGCQSLAAALQVVLIPQGANVVAPENVALATNVNCSHCGAFAYAYQYVVTVSKNTALDHDAHAAINQLRAEADQDVRAGLPYPELDSKLTQLSQRLRTIVDEGLNDQGVSESGKKSNRDVKEHPQI